MRADVNAGIATFSARLTAVESGFRVLKQGSVRASSFVQQPIATPTPLVDLRLVRISRHGTDFLKPENGA